MEQLQKIQFLLLSEVSFDVASRNSSNGAVRSVVSKLLVHTYMLSIPEVIVPQHHGSDSHHHHDKHRHWRYDELLTGEENHKTEGNYHWSQWLKNNIDPPRAATVYRPVMEGEDPADVTLWRVYWGDYTIPFAGIYTVPNRRTAEQMIGRGSIVELTADLSDIDHVAVCFWSPGRELEMCRLADYDKLLSHHHFSPTLRPHNTWRYNDPIRDPKDYTTIIVLPPTSALTCLIVLRNVKELAPRNAIIEPKVANEDA